MSELRRMINESVRFIRTKTKMKPRIGIILGTGLGRLAREIKLSVAIPYEQIPNFPVSTVETHTGRLLFGRLEKKEVVAMQGRFHYYEGYSAKEITLPVRVMKFLGVRTLIVSNACGGLNPQFKAGDLMIITDHINLQPENPLRGPNDDRLGPRFPDMYNCYDKKLVSLAKRVALDNKIPVHTGVYVALQGPNLETAAEYRFLRIIGGDVVGMSTVPEVIVARHMGIKVLGVSVITDMGLPDALGPMNLLKIVLTAKKAEPKLSRLIRGIVQRL